MKKIIIVFISILFIACSAPTYTYNFDHYPSGKTGSRKPANNFEKSGDIATNAELPDQTKNDYSSMPNSSLELTAGVSSEPFIQAPKQAIVTDAHNISSEIASSRKKGLLKALKNFIKSPDYVQESGSKNGFAIAGFVCALVGLFVLWPLCILGLIFSIIGLKSQKRGLAIAGLVLGIVGIVLVLVASSNGTL